MVSMVATSAVDCGFESRSGQNKDCKIGICCFSAKHEGVGGKTEWSNMSISTISIQLSMLVLRKD
jgi:hypothetical protein